MFLFLSIKFCNFVSSERKERKRKKEREREKAKQSSILSFDLEEDEDNTEGNSIISRGPIL